LFLNGINSYHVTLIVIKLTPLFFIKENIFLKTEDGIIAYWASILENASPASLKINGDKGSPCVSTFLGYIYVV
jgi:hypothetical protein